MSKEIYLSVLMAVKNCRENPGKTLNSILGQSYENFEVIIADDGQNVDVSELLDGYTDEDERIRICEPGSVSLPEMRNACLRLARGKYVMFVEPGDIVCEDAFRMMHRIAVTKEPDILAGLFETITSTGVHRNRKRKSVYEAGEFLEKDDPFLLHDAGLENKWIRRDLTEQKNIRFGDFGQMSETAFVLTLITESRAVYTCPYMMLRADRRLIDEAGRVVIRRKHDLDAGALRGCINAFSLVCQMTAGFGDDYIEELAVIFLQKILIDTYYRHIWLLDEECEELLISYLEKLVPAISAEDSDKIVMHNGDLVCQGGFKSKKRLLDMTFITIAVSGEYPKEYMPDLIKDLYEQAACSFSLYMEESSRELIPQEYREMENIFFAEHDVFNAALAGGSSPMIAFLDTPVMYDRQTLRRMAMSLLEKPVDMVCMMPKPLTDGTAKSSRMIERAYSKDITALEWFLSNKLFMNVILRDSHVELTGERDDAAFLMRALSHRMMKQPGMISMLSEEEIADGAESLPVSLAEKLHSGDHDDEPEKKAGGPAGFFRSLFHINDEEPETEAEDEKEEYPEKAPDECDYRKRCYYDLDINDNLILVQNEEKLPRGDLLCVIRYIAEKMPEKKIIAAVSGESDAKAERILEEIGISRFETAVFESERYIEAACSAGTIICDDLMPAWWKKKPGQHYISLYVRTLLVKAGFSSDNVDMDKVNHAASDLDLADRILVPNNYMYHRIKEDLRLPFDIENKAVMTGKPAASLLLSDSVRSEARSILGAGEDEKIVLWLPDKETRKDGFDRYIKENLPVIAAALSKDQILYVYGMEAAADEDAPNEAGRAMKVPEHVDVYEMMAAADILISDHSPMMIDFAVTRRKIIIYCADRKKIDLDPGYYVDIRTLPFPYAENREDLANELASGINYDDRDFLMVFNRFDSNDNMEKLL